MRWDGFALAFVGAAYGLWHWRRQPRVAVRRALRLALDAARLN
jgi:hypothetical protein